ncbi:MAG: hypothetical protein M1820_008476 [Bogoriella megaspora]|nr:MAG: hypothetical protein M1820_008476 [Bogoriella megaspora]
MPSATLTLAQRIQSLSDNVKQTSTLITRLSNLKFQPGSTAGDANDVRVELSGDIHESLKQQEEELELLRQEIEDLSVGVPVAGPQKGRRRDSGEKGRERARLGALVGRLGEDLKQAHLLFRHAQLNARRSSTRAKHQERALLLSSLRSPPSTSPRPSSPSSSPPPPRHRTPKPPPTQSDILLTHSSNITASLRSTHSLLTDSLSRSRFAQETLDASTAALNELSTSYTSLDDLLAASKGLVGTLLRSQKSDTWYLETTFYLLLGTLAWLVYRRWLYGPLWWLVYLPLKLIYRGLVILFSIGGVSTGISKSTSVGGTAGSTAANGSLSAQSSVLNSGIPTYSSMADKGDAETKSEGQHGQESLSDRVGRIAEESRAGDAAEQQGEHRNENDGNGGGEDDGRPRRADGTVLVESDRPRNPKKRMFEAPVEDKKYEEMKAREARERNEL